MLNDSVFQPSTVQILVDKEELYRYQVKHAEEDAISKSSCAPMKVFFLHLYEYRNLNLPNHLKYIWMTWSIFTIQTPGGHYSIQSKSEDAKIVFRGNIKSKNLEVDQKWYDLEKSRSLNQIEQVWKYIDETEVSLYDDAKIFWRKPSDALWYLRSLHTKKKKNKRIW